MVSVVERWAQEVVHRRVCYHEIFRPCLFDICDFRDQYAAVPGDKPPGFKYKADIYLTHERYHGLRETRGRLRFFFIIDYTEAAPHIKPVYPRAFSSYISDQCADLVYRLAEWFCLRYLRTYVYMYAAQPDIRVFRGAQKRLLDGREIEAEFILGSPGRYKFMRMRVYIRIGAQGAVYHPVELFGDLIYLRQLRQRFDIKE